MHSYKLQVISYNYIDNEEDKVSNLLRKEVLPTRPFPHPQSAHDHRRFLPKLMREGGDRPYLFLQLKPNRLCQLHRCDKRRRDDQ